MMIIFITIPNLLELRKGAIIKWFNTESRKDTEQYANNTKTIADQK